MASSKFVRSLSSISWEQLQRLISECHVSGQRLERALSVPRRAYLQSALTRYFIGRGGLWSGPATVR
jgi:ActR/RegA family two-component response regulator